MGVTRTHDFPGLPGNNNFKVFYNGAVKVGYKDCNTGHMAINSRPRADRGSCQQYGFCFQGCKSGAKWSTLYTEIPAAEKTGKLELRTECHVARIEHNAKGKVTGVVYFDKDRKEQRQQVRVVCVAGNSIETPRLLLLSASNKFPDGLANSSGQVGRNYQRHTTGSVYATFEQPVHMYRAARPWPVSSRTKPTIIPSAVSLVAMSWRRCRSDCHSWRHFSTRAPGAAVHEAMDNYVNMAGLWDRR
jgi:choline dehydrogenase-like flavoprotein